MSWKYVQFGNLYRNTCWYSKGIESEKKMTQHQVKRFSHRISASIGNMHMLLLWSPLLGFLSKYFVNTTKHREGILLSRYFVTLAKLFWKQIFLCCCVSSMVPCVRQMVMIFFSILELSSWEQHLTKHGAI